MKVEDSQFNCKLGCFGNFISFAIKKSLWPREMFARRGAYSSQ